jgi:hypothetical protein
VQLLVQHAAPLHTPLLHVVLPDWYTQFCASFEHAASVVEFAHALPGAPQTGSALHVHAAAPAAPAQLWCGPQAAGPPYDKQPLLPSAQVASPPLMHDVWPWVQLFVHDVEHEAPGSIPEHDFGMTQVDVEST